MHGPRLHIDPPYPGESMSSVVSRAAQTYAVRHSNLVNELLAGQRWPADITRDMDFNPPISLEKSLQLRVHGWNSPVKRTNYFHGRKLAPKFRTTYCPLCFEGDLQDGRTPYFRLSWASSWTTFCWIHRCPLMDWTVRSQVQYRKLPDCWVHGNHADSDEVPAFHLHNLDAARRFRAEDGDVLVDGNYEKADVRIVLQLLWRAQNLLERPGDEVDCEPQLNHDLHLLRYAFVLTQMGAAQFSPMHEHPAAHATYRPALSPFLSDVYDWMNITTNPSYDRCIRNTCMVAWRRTYLWFAVRTLATSRRFSLALTGRELSSCQWPSWWADELLTLLGPRTKEHFDTQARFIAPSLAERPPGTAISPNESFLRCRG